MKTHAIAPSDRKIVVIDDDRDFAESLQDLLEIYDYQVTCAHDLPSAERVIRELQPDVAFIDIRLDRDNGLDLLKRLSEEMPSLICIMITAYSETDTAIEALRHHAYDYLRKPIQPSSLLDSLNRALEKMDLENKLDSAQGALRASEERFRVIAETSPVALIISRADDDEILYANKHGELLFGVEGDGIVGRFLPELLENVDAKENMLESLKSGEQILGREILLTRYDGSTICVSLSAKPIVLQGQQVICSALLDITETYELSRQLSYQASYDSLTGLVNRREFEKHLQRAINSGQQSHTENALCYLDLDQFKVINDTCGHVAGDELLRQLGQALQSHIRKRDILARLGGDEFAVLIENCTLQQAQRVANAIRQAIQDFRFHWEDKTFNIGVSIGLVPMVGESETINDLLRRADTACYAAKDKGRNRIHIYHPDDEELAKRHGEMQWVARLNAALEQGRLQLWSQRIVPVDAGAISGEHYELLLRMVDENGNSVPPGAFLPAAERYNLAPRVDRWVIAATFEWFSRYPEELERLRMCSINLSGQSLSDEEFLRDIIKQFDQSNVLPEKICFEVTETSAIANLTDATHFIKALKERGCSFALDDFGSGLSSFGYLKNLPVDFLKIDGQFVKDILVDPIDLAMVKSINEIGHVMGKKTIAEFAENTAILKKLREVGVDYAQGYGVEEPRPLTDLVEIKAVMQS
jgi:diguanylate cyclase (GGDEF)-like protein/PAS domain S-box-containing protein